MVIMWIIPCEGLSVVLGVCSPFHSGEESIRLADRMWCMLYEPRHEKNGFLHMRKQRHRSASR